VAKFQCDAERIPRGWHSPHIVTTLFDLSIMFIAHYVSYNYIRHVLYRAADTSSLLCKFPILVRSWVGFKAETRWVQNFWVGFSWV